MEKKIPLIRVSDSVVFTMSITALIALILDFGYSLDYWTHLITDVFYLLFGAVFTVSFLNQFPGIHALTTKPLGFYVASLTSVVLLVFSVINTINFLIYNSTEFNRYTTALVFILTLFDISGRLYKLNRQTLHPALVFALSFVVLICIGSLILMSPKATVNGIDFLDALFTSTSAVCVTGLAVLDTGKDFTLLGKITILGLIQFGALGMLSFTSLFALFFKGSGSFESRLNLKNMINADTLGGTFQRLVQIVIFVFLVEAIGAIVIFFTIKTNFETFNEKLFFSIFHSISAFCNAGFSTLSNSLYEEAFRYNYSLHMIIAVLIIFGGLGYGVVLNLLQFIRKYFIYTTGKIFSLDWGGYTQKFKPNVSLNSKIVIYTSLILIFLGTLFFYLLEYENSLRGHSEFGKVITALFGSVTTRTAGFNTVDTGNLHLSTIMIVLLLMWIGASPGSTGGGIKTTTFAVATFNIVQQVFGYRNITVGYRKISPKALQRATAIISLSLITIGISTFMIIFFDEHLGVMEIAFESFSAFSTVGLSMGITAKLSESSKLVIIITMFVGRVSLLTILTGMVRQLYDYRYSPINYPEEEIFIN